MSRHLRSLFTAFAALTLATGGTALAQQQQKQQGQQQAQQGQEQELAGKITSKARNRIFIETEQGAVVPFELGRDTQYEGQAREGQQVSSARQLEEGDQVRVTFTSGGAQNAAQKVHVEQSQQELSGRVAATTRDTILIEHEGALVPLKVERHTSYQGKTRQGQPIESAQQIQEGDQVRAAFQVRNQKDNVAQTIEVQPGQQQGQQQQGQQQQGQQQPGQQQGQQQRQK